MGNLGHGVITTCLSCYVVVFICFVLLKAYNLEYTVPGIRYSSIVCSLHLTYKIPIDNSITERDTRIYLFFHLCKIVSLHAVVRFSVSCVAYRCCIPNGMQAAKKYTVLTLVLSILTSSVLVANPKNYFYAVSNPARGLLNRKKRAKRESLAAHPPPPPP